MQFLFPFHLTARLKKTRTQSRPDRVQSIEPSVALIIHPSIAHWVFGVCVDFPCPPMQHHFDFVRSCNKHDHQFQQHISCSRPAPPPPGIVKVVSTMYTNARVLLISLQSSKPINVIVTKLLSAGVSASPSTPRTPPPCSVPSSQRFCGCSRPSGRRCAGSGRSAAWC